MFINQRLICLRFDIVWILLGARWHFNGVALSDNTDVALQVAFRSAQKVIWIGQQCPLVIKQMIC